jgi:hypothetical protein
MPDSPEDVAAGRDVLARAADPEPNRDAVRLDQRGFRRLELEPTARTVAEAGR